MQSWMWGLSVVERLARGEGLGAAEIATELGIARATVYRLLAELEREGWVSSAGSPKRYSVSLKVVPLAAQTLTRHRTRSAVVPYISEACLVTGEVIHLCFYQPGGFVIGTDRAEPSARGPVASLLGSLAPATATASGKVLLAYQPPAEVEAVLAGPLHALTPQTITDPARLANQLVAAREQGFATTDREQDPRICAVAVPVFDEDGAVAAAIGVPMAGPLDGARVETIAAAVRRVAERASTALGHGPGAVAGT